MNSTLEAALKYAALGLAVFPCRNKIPVTPKGFYDATTDEVQIRLWWDVAEAQEVHGIAIATGSKFGIAALDIDPRNGGDDSLDGLRKDGIELGATPLCLTGGGGKHYYFSIPRGVEFKGRSAIRPGIDLKADGGYCVAPPSPHASGKPYLWELSSAIGDIPLAPIPEALRLLLVQDKAVLPGSDAKPKLSRALPDEYAQGTRHGFLLSALGSMRRKNFSQPAALAAIREENRIKCKPPFTEPEIITLTADVFKRWQAQESVKIGVAVAEAIKVPQDDGLTDMGNSNRFVEKFGDVLRYCFAIKSWVCYDDKRWVLSAQGDAERAAQTVAKDLHAEARALQAEAQRAAKDNRADDQEKLTRRAQAVGAWAKKSESAGRVAAILSLAQSQVEIDENIFDQKPMLLNFTNGTVDLATGMLLPHCKTDYITMMIAFDYDPDAKCPYFDYFRLSIMGGDTSKADALLRCLGYTITGLVKEQVMFCCYGPTSANGKSKLFDAIRGMLGDYACSAPDGMMEEQNFEKHPTQLAVLKNKRFVSTIETGQGKRMAENLVKKLTGGDIITSRKMFCDFTEHAPTHKLWLASNFRLKINLDPAVLRRIVEFPFEVHFWDAKKGESGPEHLRQDPLCEDKLKAEYQGIAAALVRGCLEYQRIGLALPNDILQAIEDYKAEMDQVGEWIEECCSRIQGAHTSGTDMFRSFALWAERNKKGRLSQTAFGLQMAQAGCEKKKGNLGKMWYQNIALKENQEQWQEQRQPGEEG